MSNKRFPKFQSHQDVLCSSCGMSLADTQPRNDGYAHNNGQFSKECSCGLRTWYDLKQAEIEGDTRLNTLSIRPLASTIMRCSGFISNGTTDTCVRCGYPSVEHEIK